jgi:hypothetical protein
MNRTYSNESQTSPVASDPISAHSGHRNAADGDMMDDGRSDASRFSTTAIDRRITYSDHGDHHNPLYDYAMNDSRITPQWTNTAATEPTSNHVDNHFPPAEPLLHQEHLSKTLPGWPTTPKPIRTPVYIKLLNGVFDILLLTCSAAFLAFALIVNIHDQASTADNARLTKTLLDATKYVRSLVIIDSRLS